MKKQWLLHRGHRSVNHLPCYAVGLLSADIPCWIQLADDHIVTTFLKSALVAKPVRKSRNTYQITPHKMPVLVIRNTE